MAGKPNILIADDDRLIIQMLTDLLEGDYNIHTAGDGAAAMEIVAKTELAAVLSDHMMPKVTGVELLTQVLDAQPDAVRILITATEDVKDLHDAVNTARVHRFVVKPIRTLEFPRMLQGAIREAQLEEENKRLVTELSAAVDELTLREQELERELNIRTQELQDVMQLVGEDA